MIDTNRRSSSDTSSNFAASAALYNIAQMAQKNEASSVSCCLKCLGHGRRVLYVNGHVNACPYSTCSCEMCAHVTCQSVSWIVRRNRIRQRRDQLAVQQRRSPARQGDHSIKTTREFLMEGMRNLRTVHLPANNNAVHATADRQLLPNSTQGVSENSFEKPLTITPLIPPVSNVSMPHQIDYSSAAPHSSESTITYGTIAALLATSSSRLLAELECRSKRMSPFQPSVQPERFPALLTALNTPPASIDPSPSDSQCSVSSTISITSPEDTSTADQIVYLPLTTSEASLLGGQRLSRNLYVPYDADRSHPAFSKFIASVQQLEQTMLG
ncbi:hypothetical protein PRIPAC_80075 [Pristionchus pacificus]|uniref:DM domain-containing protein n=1 Tax=Pristionchus pacificus TaxID=54126 RepID=A0A2A6CPX7_PRIPA|nr:hypothetical protein PRIPAC_80075 [Pristionchus pacificus]|eukprot:PDM80091.1 hypothetical protein PRIPAC_32670 [Pristionchus pacificus]